MTKTLLGLTSVLRRRRWLEQAQEKTEMQAGETPSRRKPRFPFCHFYLIIEFTGCVREGVGHTNNGKSIGLHCNFSSIFSTLFYILKLNEVTGERDTQLTSTSLVLISLGEKK